MGGAGFRLDRLVSVYVCHALARIGVRRTSAGIPVLMYHSISEEPEAGVTPYYRTVTHPDVFHNHMHYLRAQHYTVLNLEDAVTTLQAGGNSQKKYVVLTFDDGLRDFYTTAFPMLKQHGFTATMFVPTGLINAGQPIKGKAVMTWEEMRELQRQGIQFGSHTVTHPHLHSLPLEEVQSELETSKAHLEEQLGTSIQAFCYPYAFPEDQRPFTQALKAIMVQAGYQYATGTRIGTFKPGDDPYFIKRIPMNSCDDLQLLRAKLAGAYDWLHYPQLAYKTCKQYITPKPQTPLKHGERFYE